MTSSTNARALPTTVKVAAWLLAVSATAVPIYVIVQQATAGWEQPGNILQPAIRFLGMSVVAWGLLKGARWAWWLGVVVPIFFLIMVGVAFVGALPIMQELNIRPPTDFLVAASVSIAGMATAVILLVRPVSRAAFRKTVI